MPKKIFLVVFCLLTQVSCHHQAINQAETLSSQTYAPTEFFEETRINGEPTLLMAPSVQAQSTPGFFETDISCDFLFENETDSCQLPCWNNLEINNATVSDINEFYLKTLHFDADYSFQEDALLTSGSPLTTYHTYWFLGDGEFSVILYLDKEQILRAMSIGGGGKCLSDSITIGHMLENRGYPIFSAGRIENTQLDTVIILSMVFIYQDGMIFDFSFGIDLLKDESYDPVTSSIQFCTDRVPTSSKIVFVDGFINGISERSSVQDHFLESYCDYVPFVEISDIEFDNSIDMNPSEFFCFTIEIK